MAPYDPHTEEWYAERRKGIGGSDWGSVLNEPPYGCARRLWYDKTNTPPDYDEESPGHLERGQRMEQIVVDVASDRLGRRILKCGAFARNPLPDWWIGNPDRRITAVDNMGPGVFEAKTMNPWVFRKVQREGLPLTMLAQVDHYLGLTGWKWGILYVLEPVNFEAQAFSIDRDQSRIDMMVDVGERFWNRVRSGPGHEPPKLDPGDARCKTCQWRSTCQGVDILFAEEQTTGDIEVIHDFELIQLAERYDQFRAIESDAKKEKEAIRDDIKVKLGDPKKAQAGTWNVAFTRSMRTRLNGKKLKAERPEIYEQYATEAPSETLTVTARNGGKK